MGTGGSIESISIAGRSYAVAADADAQVKFGGFENEHQANGNGTARQIKTRVVWAVTGLTLDIDDDNGDHEFLQERADSKRDEVFTITYASGAVYQGTGGPTGEIQKSTQSTTAAVNFTGPGKLTKQ
jgi:hypothetical protein